MKQTKHFKIKTVGISYDSDLINKILSLLNLSSYQNITNEKYNSSFLNTIILSFKDSKLVIYYENIDDAFNEYYLLVEFKKVYKNIIFLEFNFKN